MKGLRKRATRARRAIRQVGESLTALNTLPEVWLQFAAEVAELVKLIRPTERPDDLALIVKSLESRNSQADAWLREASQSVEISPLGLADEPHTISTNLSFNPKDTVIAAEESSRGVVADPPPSPTVSGTEGKDEVLEASVDFKPFERVEKLHPGELLELAPRLAAYVDQRYPDWSDIIAAGGNALRHELGVSQALWGEACRIVGRQLAVVILAIISTKPQEHFTRGAGGYFAAMIKRAPHRRAASRPQFVEAPARPVEPSARATPSLQAGAAMGVSRTGRHGSNPRRFEQSEDNPERLRRQPLRYSSSGKLKERGGTQQL